MRRRDRIVLFLIAIIAAGTFIFGILAMVGVGMRRSQPHSPPRFSAP